MFDFLLVDHCNYSSIFYHFWVTWCWIISWPWKLTISASSQHLIPEGRTNIVMICSNMRHTMHCIWLCIPVMQVMCNIQEDFWPTGIRHNSCVIIHVLLDWLNGLIVSSHYNSHCSECVIIQKLISLKKISKLKANTKASDPRPRPQLARPRKRICCARPKPRTTNAKTTNSHCRPMRREWSFLTW